MSEASCPIYVFRSDGFSAAGDTIVSLAPAKCVVAVYGGGDAFDSGGVAAAFGGTVVFKNEETDELFLGVWGARNASRFRSELRAQMAVQIINSAPIGRRVLRRTDKTRPKQSVSR